MEDEIKGLKIRKWIEYFEETLENETGRNLTMNQYENMLLVQF